MGICINLAVSKSVTKEEWAAVYEETLQLVKKFPFAETRTVMIHDIETICLVRTEERKIGYGLFSEEGTRTGWRTNGDYRYLRSAESYELYRDWIGDSVEALAEDAMFGAVSPDLMCDWEEDRFQQAYSLWGNKTQGEPYHIYLLAVAALIEARLGTKAFIYGDVTRGQCKKAVKIANQYLEKPIGVPDRCDMDRWFNRITKMNLTPDEKMELFECFYLGNKDAMFGEYLRQKFPEDVCKRYWKKQFDEVKFHTIGFDKRFKKYILWGFNLEKIFDYIELQKEENDNQYEGFVIHVLDAKLHWKHKNCKDILEIDQDEWQPYSIWTLMAQVTFAGLRNPKIDRYIPIEEIQRILSEKIGDKCDVQKIIEDYLAEEKQELKKMHVTNSEIPEEELKEAMQQDSAGAFNQVMENKRIFLQEQYEKYEIVMNDDLKFYKAGDRIEPSLQDVLVQFIVFQEKILQKSEHRKMQRLDTHSKCQWLQKNNPYILIRDEDWEKIYSDIENNENAFERYYALLRIKQEKREIREIIIALMINDELYTYSIELAKKEKANSDKRVEFGVNCVEMVAERLGESISKIITALTVESTILGDFIISEYERLNMLSDEEVVEEIIEEMRKKHVEI